MFCKTCFALHYRPVTLCLLLLCQLNQNAVLSQKPISQSSTHTMSARDKGLELSGSGPRDTGFCTEHSHIGLRYSSLTSAHRQWNLDAITDNSIPKPNPCSPDSKQNPH
ncbi:hypothetical protein F5X98DRAFT_183492 [Xylaria grammica]|nr:hypothetical protein F5X98DRAFT_183492 [Xylaria grammica]